MSRFALPICAMVISLIALGACRTSGGVRVRQPTSTPAPQPSPTVPVLTTLTAPATVTNDGLQIIDLKVGDGDTARVGDNAYVTYNEWLPDGKLVDTTSADGKIFSERQVLRDGQIIPGLIEGIAGMKVGGKRRLVIPPALAHGPQGVGNAAVPADAAVVYEIELVRLTHP